MQNIVKNVAYLRRTYNSGQMTAYLLTVNCTVSPFLPVISEFRQHNLGTTVRTGFS